MPLFSRHLSCFRRCGIRDIVGQHTPQHRHLLTLAIETSCDDTCVSILEYNSPDTPHNQLRPGSASINNGSLQSRARLHFNEKITAKNTGRGGIHPVEAMASHQVNLATLVDKALLSLPALSSSRTLGGSETYHIICRNGIRRQKPDFVSVTRGPGMRGNLACGLDQAKGLAVAWQVPLVGVHHMQAHTLTPRMVDAMNSVEDSAAISLSGRHEPEFPFLTLLVSGGHTTLLYSTGLTEHKVLASKGDIAIGDALDKCGRLLLPPEFTAQTADTSFGKYLSAYAYPNAASFHSWPIPQRRRDEIDKPPNEFGWQMQTPLANTRDMLFSFSAIPSRAESLVQERESTLRGNISAEEKLLLARTVIGCAFEHLGSRTVIALEQLRSKGVEIRNLVVSGGVAANDFLRYYLRAMLTARGFEHVNLVFPPVQYCTDNAAMIAWAGMEMYQAGYTSELSIMPLRKWSMGAGDDGILGVGGWRRTPADSLPNTSCVAEMHSLTKLRAVHGQ